MNDRQINTFPYGFYAHTVHILTFNKYTYLNILIIKAFFNILTITDIYKNIFICHNFFIGEFNIKVLSNFLLSLIYIINILR